MDLKWKKWQNMTQTGKGGAKLSKKALIEVTGNAVDFLEELNNQLTPYALHVFTAKWQFRQYKTLKANLPPKTLLTVADFAENYRCTYQDEITSAYYNYEQVTVHPFFCTFEKDGERVEQSVVILSSKLQHDA